jgi:opacity protein-like surface antigen
MKGRQGMLLKKVLFLHLSVLLIAASTLYAAEGSRHLSKKNAFSIKIGAHLYEDSDFTDRWEIDEQDLAGFAWELAYERKTKYIGIEFSLGHNFSSADSNNILAANDSLTVDIENFYLSPTAKFYAPLSESFVFYGGIGPDCYYTATDYQYKDGSTIDKDDHFFTFGLHGLAGVEYYFIKRPAKKREFDGPTLYNVPVSVLFEYRYSWLEIEDADQVLIANLDSDLDIGGHLVFVGLRWHY